MPEPSNPQIIPPGKRAPQQLLDWPKAYLKFLQSSKEHKTLKMMPLVLVGIVPLSVLDDLLLPGIGLLDDIPTGLLAVIVLAITANKVRQYR